MIIVAGEIQRTDEYRVEIDETIWTPEALADWSRTFWHVKDCEEFAKGIAETVMKCGSGFGFMEGYGYLKIIHPSGRQEDHYKEGFKEVSDEELCPGITVYIQSEDEDYWNQMEEVES